MLSAGKGSCKEQRQGRHDCSNESERTLEGKSSDREAGKNNQVNKAHVSVIMEVTENLSFYLNTTQEYQGFSSFCTI